MFSLDVCKTKVRRPSESDNLEDAIPMHSILCRHLLGPL